MEAQKDEPMGYEILNRAIFYVSRLISSQKERDFENSSYDDIKRVYSIWVCMNMDKNSMSHVHLTKEDLIGSYNINGKEWHKKSGLPLKRFFNTSGLLYKEMKLKDKLSEMSEEEQLKLLATNGMLVKRPIVVGDDMVLVGFKEAEWTEKMI